MKQTLENDTMTAGAAATGLIINDGGHASVAARVGCERLGELQDLPPCSQRSPMTLHGLVSD